MKLLKCYYLIVGALLASPVFADTSVGESVFNKWCLGCHAQGPIFPGTIYLTRTRGPERAIISERTDLTAEYIELLVRKGMGGMPSFRRTEITNDQLNALVEHLVSK